MFTVDWFHYDAPSYVIDYDPTTFKELWRVPAGKGGHYSELSPDDKYLICRQPIWRYSVGHRC